jgi:hypothetical protein
MSIEVALGAMDADAVLWDGVSSVLETASNAASGLVLTERNLSRTATSTGFLAKYEEARARIERLLAEGATETTGIATTLRQVRDVYIVSDEDAQAAYDNVWEPVQK